MSRLRDRICERPLLTGMAGGMALSSVVAALVALYVLSGGYNTAASSAHGRIVAWAVHSTMVNSVQRRAPSLPQPVVSSASLMSGAIEYEKNCIECHGGPGVARAPWVSAMLPTPPFLIDARQHWTHGELYEVVSQGVKMTGMPAWGEVMPRSKVEDVVAFVEMLPDIPPGDFARLRSAARISIERERQASPLTIQASSVSKH